MIEAAESLFAEHGVVAVSTRQIGAAIGSLNTNVVAYHFGSKDELIEAVYRHRLPEIDRRRGELLAELDRAGTCHDLVELTRAFALPLFEQKDREGRHSYARFLSSIERSGLVHSRAALIPDFPNTSRLIDRMTEALDLRAEAHIHMGLRLANSLVTTALQVLDQEGPHDAEQAQAWFDSIIRMAAAAIAASISLPFPSSKDELT